MVIQNNLRGKKLHRRNQGSNFLGDSFSNRDNVRGPIQFRRESQVLVLPSWPLEHPAADDDFVMCRNAPHRQVLVLPSWCLVLPTADDDFVKCWNTPFGQLFALPSWRLVLAAADNDFVICQNAPCG